MTAMDNTNKPKPFTGRRRVGLGAHVISLTVERGLLDACDELARSRGISRAALIAEGLRLALKQHGVEPPNTEGESGT